VALNRLRIAGLVLLSVVTLSCRESRESPANVQQTWVGLDVAAAMDRIDMLIAQRKWLAARVEMTFVLEAINRNRPLYGSQTRAEVDRRLERRQSGS
jgi:hypothetical protein